MDEAYAFVPPPVTHLKGKKARSRFAENEAEGLSAKRNDECRSRDSEFADMKERSRLFECEFNHEELHDRILVVQVMPDDYEIQELQARLEVYETEQERGESPKFDNVVEGELVLESHGVSRTEEVSGEGPNESRSDEQPIAIFPSVSYNSSVQWQGTETRPDDELIFERETDSESGSGIVLKGFNDSKTKLLTSSVPQSHRTRSPSEVATKSRFGEMLSENFESFSDFDGEKPADESLERCGSVEENSFEENETGSDGPEACGVRTKAFDVRTEACGFPSNSEACGVRAKAFDVRTETYSFRTEACGVRVLREHRVFVHACWLAVNSSYFRSLLFQSGMKECSSKEFCMKVTESEEAAFMILIESIYNPIVLNNLDINTLLAVLRLSVKYDVKFSSRKAARVLHVIPLTLEICEAIIEAIGKGGMPDMDDIMEKVEVVLFREFTPLDDTWESDKFASLSKGAIRVLLGSDKLKVQSENTVFVALMRWIAKHSEVYGDLAECSDLVNLVRFGLIKPSYLHDVVREHEVANRLDNFDAVYLAAITHHALPEKRRRTPRKRRLCHATPTTPTYMWILDVEPEMFDFDEEDSINSRLSSSFWFFGYQMHLRLDLSPMEDSTRLILVVENMSEDGSVRLAYDVDVKFSNGLHKSYTSDPFVYRGKRPSRGKNPFHEKFSLEEIKEILLGGSVRVTIIFEISIEKLVD